MLDLEKPIRSRENEHGRWDNGAECARLLILYPEFRKDWNRADLLALALEIRGEFPELSQALGDI